MQGVRKPSMWLEGLLALLAAAAMGLFFFYFGFKWGMFTRPSLSWLPMLNFPVVGALLALSTYFFFPNQTWRIPLVMIVAYGMFIAGYPPDKKLNFGLDLAGGTEILVKVGQTAEEVRSDELNKRIDDISTAVDAQNGKPEAKDKLDKLVLSLKQRDTEINARLVELAGVTTAVEERRTLVDERGKLRYRLDDLNGKNNSQLEAIRKDRASISTSNKAAEITSALDILRERILSTSLTEIRVAQSEQNHIVIQIPGLDQGRVDIIKKVIERQGILAFRLVKQMSDEDRTKAKNGEQLRGFDLVKNREGDPLYLERMSADMNVTGGDVSSARPYLGTKGWEVSLELNTGGAAKFGRLTRANVNRLLAIILDDEIMIAPNIEVPITDGRAAITGGFTKERAEEISTVIRAGSLPVKLVIDSETKVGAALGEDSIRAGEQAIVVGLAAVVIIMVGYYLGAGLFSIFALLLNAAIILGCLALFGATLTFSGIAGIVLTLGMAVDANVLINERIREEKAAGKSLKVAIQNGYDRAFVVIFDSNITTIFTCIILYAVGTVNLKSFAVTLTIGLLASMFTAVFMTRALIEAFYDLGAVTKLTMLRLVPNTSIDFLRWRNWAAFLSIVTIFIGLYFFFTGAKYGIEFTGGTTIQMSTATNIPITQVRDVIKKSIVPNATVQLFASDVAGAASGSSNRFVISYSMTDVKGEEGKQQGEISKDVVEFIRKNIPELAPDPYTNVAGVDRTVVTDKKFPDTVIKADEIQVSEFTKMGLNLSEPSTAEKVKAAINSIPYSEGINPPQKISVLEIEPAGEGKKFTVLVRTEMKSRFSDPDNMMSSVQGEMQKRLKDEKINLSDPFPLTRAIGASLSSDLTERAIWSVLLSCIVLLIYIGFRFTLAFGLGALLSLLHDLFITLGFLAIFKVDITLDVLAAILTVLGYSLNDTIIVFDRIRENMKESKTRNFMDVMNHSINQIIGRTLLTGGTTLVVVLALMFLAGDVLYGFSLALTIGVITGTYSSWFIATPVVAAYELYRRKRDESAIRRQRAE
ncbi:MAG: protein translocase subunit SecD [Candidatus Brocadiia bacterium]